MYTCKIKVKIDLKMSSRKLKKKIAQNKNYVL